MIDRKKLFFKLLTILTMVRVFAIFVTDNPVILGFFIFSMLILFRMKLMLSYWILAAACAIIFLLFYRKLIFFAYLVYYTMELTVWVDLLAGFKAVLFGVKEKGSGEK